MYDAVGIKIAALNLGNKQEKQCLDFAKDLLCQECSPYAAHVYENEPSFPEICLDYCHTLYDNCGLVLETLLKDNDLKLAFRASKDEFCTSVFDPNNAVYCYPEIIDNTDLNKAIDRQTNSEAGCMCVVEFANGLYNPLRLLPHPTDMDRIYILEQSGHVILFINWNRLKTPFLDMKSRIRQPTSQGDENGLLGLCFHLDYKNNRKLYVGYTIDGGPGVLSVSVVSQFQHELGNPDKVDMDTEIILLKVNQPSRVHNGGEVRLV